MTTKIDMMIRPLSGMLVTDTLVDPGDAASGTPAAASKDM
jgi:hypothetical protein